MERQIQSVKEKKPSGHGLPNPQNFFKSLIRLKEANDAGNRP